MAREGMACVILSLLLRCSPSPLFRPALVHACTAEELLELLAVDDAMRARQKERRVIVYHDGVLSRFMGAVRFAFEQENPGWRVELESSSSMLAVRKVTDLGAAPDIVAVGGSYLLQHMFVAGGLSPCWVQFAVDEVVLAAAAGRSVSLPPTDRWPEAVEGRLGVVDLRGEPFGAYTMMFALLYDRMQGGERASQVVASVPSKHRRFSPMALAALLESGGVDFAILPRSVAEAHGLPYLRFPPRCSLGDSSLASYYAASVSVAVPLAGGRMLKVKGQPLYYSLCILNDAPHPAAARRFCAFLLGRRGQEIADACGLGGIYRDFSSVETLIESHAR